MVLDHLIALVPDLRRTHERLIELGLSEAWPPGPFWPEAITSGIALGGVNLELVQPDAGVPRPSIETLVLAPSSLEEGRELLAGFIYEERDKIEPSAELLALRGFPPEMSATPQRICTNLYPKDPPYPFFLCLYAPFLKTRLDPLDFPSPRGGVSALQMTAPDAESTRRLFAGRLGPIELSVDSGDPQVIEIRFADGSSLTPADL